MAFIEPMHRNKPNITYLLNSINGNQMDTYIFLWHSSVFAVWYAICCRNHFAVIRIKFWMTIKYLHQMNFDGKFVGEMVHGLA